jgi:hypothetical protein
VRLITVLSIIGSLGVYFLTIILLKSSINAATIDTSFLMKVLFLTLVSWGPLHIAKVVIRRLDPSEEQKIMKSKRRNTQELDVVTDIQ